MQEIYSIYKKNNPVTPKQVAIVVDLGYLGIEKDYPDKLLVLPCKKKINLEDLSQEEKWYNKIYSKKRIVIEHAICRLKKYMIMNDILETN
jgi:hypothetical protein